MTTQKALKMAGEALEKLLPWAIHAEANAEDALDAIRSAQDWQPLAKAPGGVPLTVGVRLDDGSWFSPSGFYSKEAAMRSGYTYFFIMPEPPAPPRTEGGGG